MVNPVVLFRKVIRVITEVKIEVDFLEHLLKCLMVQKTLHLDTPDNIEKNQTVISEAVKKGMDIITPIIKQNNISKYALQKFNEKWEKDLAHIAEDIGTKDKLNQDKFLRWGLVRQEIEMLCLIGEQVGFDELAEICKQKGLDHEMKSYMIETLDYIGLGESL